MRMSPKADSCEPQDAVPAHFWGRLRLLAQLHRLALGGDADSAKALITLGLESAAAKAAP
jgi:hypothetical protein